MGEIIKVIELPSMLFDTKDEMFLALKEHSKQIIANKRVNKTKSAPFKAVAPNVENKETIKALPEMSQGFIYPIINTTMIMDSHNDVHANGIWKKSLQEAGESVVYAQNHDLSVGSIIGFSNDVEPFVKTVNWSDIGFNYKGQTEALFFKVMVSPSAPSQAKYIIENQIPIQNSVRMEYVKTRLAVNSDNPELKEQNDLYLKTIDELANKEYVQKIGYFWLQDEAKLVREGSMVIEGSNQATPITYPTNKDIQPSQDTDKKEPSEDTQKKKDERDSSNNIYTFI